MIHRSGNERTEFRIEWRLGLFVIGAMACLLLLAACGRSKAQAPQGAPTFPVKVETVEAHPVGETSEYVATIKSRNSATIMSDVEGWIFAIHVHSGDFVKKGQTLMEIDPRRQQATVSSYDSQRASKEANLQWTKVQLERAEGPVCVRGREQTGLRPGASDLRFRAG